jgi:hypothetical protein
MFIFVFVADLHSFASILYARMKMITALITLYMNHKKHRDVTALHAEAIIVEYIPLGLWLRSSTNVNPIIQIHNILTLHNQTRKNTLEPI